MKLSTTYVAVFAVVIAATAVHAQGTWEGPTGAYLNPLAINLGDDQTQGSIHHLDLQPSGSLTTFGANYGLSDRFEIGITQANLSVGGANKVDNVHAKYLLRPLGDGKPALAVGTILRTTHGGPETADFYLAATQVFPTSKPIIASLTVRSTNALGSGLFGRATGRSTQLGGFFGVQVTPKLIPNVEYYQQPDGDDWKDVGVRYLASATTTWDFGLADVGGNFGDQFALGVTHQF